MSLDDSSRRRVIPAPAPSNPRLHSPMLTVECGEDEEVEWAWTETTEGRFVSGYRIVPKVQATGRSGFAESTRPGLISKK